MRVPRPLVVHSLDLIQDTIWVGTNFGLGFMMEDSVVMVSNYPNIQDVVYYKDGMLIAGSSLVTPRRIPIPRHNLPKPDCEDCKGIYLWQNNQLRKLGVPESSYEQILEADGNYYFASDSGVVVWDGARVNKIITEQDGLTDNRTCTMALDNEGFLWVSTFSGLNRINLSTGKITRYLQNVEFNRRSVLQNDSLIYMGSMQGIYIFNPTDFLGDDIEPPAPWSTKQFLVFFSVAITLIFSVILYLVSRHNRRKLQLKEMELKEMEQQLFLVQIDQIVFNTDMAITVSSLADALDMSERTLYRTFQDYDLTPGSYLKELKLKKARYLLNGDNDHATMKKVAQKVGYTERYLSKLIEGKE